jgi:serine/threonine-protein kinase
MDRREGTLLAAGRGTYRLGRLLGRGGMAEVYAATALGAAGFERPVCVKLVLPQMATDAEFRALFLREVRIAGSLCHANLVQVFDCFEHGEQLVLVMERVDGMDLKAVVRALGRRGATMPAGLVANVAGQMLLGLGVCHRSRVVHRDVSPHNVLVSRNGEVKLADFGVAKAMSTHASRTGNLRGKLAYMSPEQARAKHVDGRTDLYSTGLVLWELLTAQRYVPRGASQWNILHEVAHAARPKVTGVEPRLARLVETLLAPEPDERYGSAEEALAALPPWEAVGPMGAVELARFLADLDDDAPTLASGGEAGAHDTLPTPTRSRAPCEGEANDTTSLAGPGGLPDTTELAAAAPPSLPIRLAPYVPPSAPGLPARPARLPPTTVVRALRDVGEYPAVGSPPRPARAAGRPAWLLAALLAFVGVGVGAGALLQTLLVR